MIEVSMKNWLGLEEGHIVQTGSTHHAYSLICKTKPFTDLFLFYKNNCVLSQLFLKYCQ